MEFVYYSKNRYQYVLEVCEEVTPIQKELYASQITASSLTKAFYDRETNEILISNDDLWAIIHWMGDNQHVIREAEPSEITLTVRA
jgi:hypothetical protein